jgi:hypothetical protein
MIARNDASKCTPFFNFVPSAVIPISCKFNASTYQNEQIFAKPEMDSPIMGSIRC